MERGRCGNGAATAAQGRARRQAVRCAYRADYKCFTADAGWELLDRQGGLAMGDDVQQRHARANQIPPADVLADLRHIPDRGLELAPTIRLRQVASRQEGSVNLSILRLRNLLTTTTTAMTRR